MIERVEAALREWLDSNSNRDVIEAGGVGDLAGAARAAIEAMKVPTLNMLVNATEEWLCVRAQEERAEVIWDAMIDTALGYPRAVKSA